MLHIMTKVFDNHILSIYKVWVCRINMMHGLCASFTKHTVIVIHGAIQAQSNMGSVASSTLLDPS